MRAKAVLSVALSVLVLFLVSFAGCSGDDDPSIVGNWDGTAVSMGETSAVTVTFNANGTWTGTGYLEIVNGTYTLNGSTLNAQAGRGSGVITVNGTLDGDTMTGTFSLSTGETGTFTLTRR